MRCICRFSDHLNQNKDELVINILKYICILQSKQYSETSLQKVPKYALDHAEIDKTSKASLVAALLCNTFTGSRN
jgi:hypothetical protein